MKDLKTALKRMVNIDRDIHGTEGYSVKIEALKESFNQLTALLPEFQLKANEYYFVNRDSEEVSRFKFGSASEDFKQTAFSCYKLCKQIMPMLGAMKEVLGNYKKNNLAGSWVSEKTPQISEAIYQIEHMVNLFACYAKTDKNDEIPLSRWITRKNNKISLHVSPISASKGLSRTVWPNCYSIIGLSATASLEGKFDRILNNCGLSVGSKVINIESPFNYQSSK
jgi:Rad3-related DNA helicase